MLRKFIQLMFSYLIDGDNAGKYLQKQGLALLGFGRTSKYASLNNLSIIVLGD